MFRFQDPQYLWLLAFVPLFVLLRVAYWYHSRRAMKKFGDVKLVRQLMPEASKWRPVVKFTILTLAYAVLCIVLARPQMGTRMTKEKRSGIEAIIAIDVSNSMLAEDVKPSRLQKTKMLVENLIDKMDDDKIGLVVFAGDAFVQLPITADYVSAKMFLNNISPTLISTQGTDLGRAIVLSSKSFTQTEGVGRAIIVITDGEDHEGGTKEAVEAARDRGANIFVLGIGSTQGAPIPLGHGNYMTDNTGATVMTALNEDMCKQLAAEGNGVYIHVDNTNDAQRLLNNHIAKLQQGETDSVTYGDYNEQFQIFALLAILLLILEIMILEIQNPRLRNLRLFRYKKALAIALLCTLNTLASAQSSRQLVRQGNRQFKNEKYDKAIATYTKATINSDDPAVAIYNTGCSYMLQQNDSAAVANFLNATKLLQDKKHKAMAMHNVGVIHQNRQAYDKAIDCYKESLRNNPYDDETRYNLALCQKLLKEQPQQNKDGEDNQNDENQKQQDQNKQDQQQEQQQQSQQQQDNSMSKENAEQLLKAAQRKEEDTRERVEQQMNMTKPRNLQKNW